MCHCFFRVWNRGVPRGVLISGGWNRGAVYRDVVISGCWNRGVPLDIEVSSFQGVGIEGFHCIKRCPHFKGLEEKVPLASYNISQKQLADDI